MVRAYGRGPGPALYDMSPSVLARLACTLRSSGAAFGQLSVFSCRECKSAGQMAEVLDDEI